MPKVKRSTKRARLQSLVLARQASKRKREQSGVSDVENDDKTDENEPKTGNLDLLDFDPTHPYWNAYNPGQMEKTHRTQPLCDFQINELLNIEETLLALLNHRFPNWMSYTAPTLDSNLKGKILHYRRLLNRFEDEN